MAASLRFLFRICLICAAILLMRMADAAPPEDREFTECADCPVMVGIPGGKFLMGSPDDERGRFDSEGPRHVVTIKPFALAKYPVTVFEFLRFLRDTRYQPEACDKVLGLRWRIVGRNLAYPPTDTEAPDGPATCLSWSDAKAYIAWLNGKLAKGRYRLPSEAEWEYAARAGHGSARWWGEQIGSGNANCTGCGSPWDGRELAPVGSFPRNPFGLGDMLGNVWQWTEDCWNENYLGAPADGSPWLKGDCQRRVMRGGSWSNVPVFVRSAARSSGDKDGRDFDYSSYSGFRLARDLP